MNQMVWTGIFLVALGLVAASVVVDMNDSREAAGETVVLHVHGETEQVLEMRVSADILDMMRRPGGTVISCDANICHIGEQGAGASGQSFPLYIRGELGELVELELSADALDTLRDVQDGTISCGMNICRITPRAPTDTGHDDTEHMK